MLRGFGNTLGPTPWGEPSAPDPNKPDPRAMAQMQAFDSLPAETRASVRESPNDMNLADKFHAIRQRGAPREVLDRLRERKLMPYQVGEGGILAEVLADELAKLPPPMPPARPRKRRL
jgi:hypothetical protein